jgi:hypothetical protein
MLKRVITENKYHIDVTNVLILRINKYDHHQAYLIQFTKCFEIILVDLKEFQVDKTHQGGMITNVKSRVLPLPHFACPSASSSPPASDLDVQLPLSQQPLSQQLALAQPETSSKVSPLKACRRQCHLQPARHEHTACGSEPSWASAPVIQLHDALSASVPCRVPRPWGNNNVCENCVLLLLFTSHDMHEHDMT